MHQFLLGKTGGFLIWGLMLVRKVKNNRFTFLVKRLPTLFLLFSISAR